MKKGVVRGFFFLVGDGGRDGNIRRGGSIRQGGHADWPQIKRFYMFVTGIEMMEEQQQQHQTHDKI